MRGSIGSQMTKLLREVYAIGESKFADKQAARAELAAVGQTATSAAIATRTDIHSVRTADNYLTRWVEIGQWAKAEMGLKNMEQLSAEVVRGFLAEKIELSVSYSHFSQYCAAVGKLEKALNSYAEAAGKPAGFSLRDFKDLRDEARVELPRFEGSRAYLRPDAVTSALAGTSQLVAKIQLESGVRVAEACHIRSSQLLGLSRDPHTGREIGRFAFIGKGGKSNIANVTPATYRELERELSARGGELKVSPNLYRGELRMAAPVFLDREMS